MTLTCAELVEQVTTYLDRALDPDAERRFEQHLGECPGCATYVEQCRQTARLVATLAPQGVPVPARDELLAAFRDRGRDRARARARRDGQAG